MSTESSGKEEDSPKSDDWLIQLLEDGDGDSALANEWLDRLVDDYSTPSDKDDDPDENKLGAVVYASLAPIYALEDQNFAIEYNPEMRLDSDGEKYEFPLIFITGHVLFPGINLNLTTEDIMLKSSLMRVRRGDNIIGVVFVNGTNDAPEFETVGVTAKIMSIIHDWNRIEVVLRGKERFCLRQITSDHTGRLVGTIHLIEDKKPFKMPVSCRFGMHKKPSKMPEAHRFGMPICTPEFAFTNYDVNFLSRKVAGLRNLVLGGASLKAKVLKHPAKLSYRIASELPISFRTKQKLLEKDTVTERFHDEIDLLNRFDRINCDKCGHNIAKRRDMVVLYNNGPHNDWKQPAAYVKGRTNVREADGLTPINAIPHNLKKSFRTAAKCVSCNRKIAEYQKDRLNNIVWRIHNSLVRDIRGL